MGKKAQYVRKDKLFEKAKTEGYRSRAAYKLLELDKRFNLLRPGQKVLDLGAWPGSWTQVVLKIIGRTGRAVAIDLVALDSLKAENLLVLQADAAEEAWLSQAQTFCEGAFDLILSDMSPKLTGIRSADQAASVACAELALYVAGQALKPGANLLIKLFKGSDSDNFVKEMRKHFDQTKRCELDSTRRSSNEFYVLGLKFKSQGSACL